MGKMMRPEHPKPQFMRKNWLNLNGKWGFEIADGNDAEERATSGEKLNGVINVPFCPESELSGIGHTDFMKKVAYTRDIDIDSSMLRGRVILHFGACDYVTDVYVNSEKAGTHRGGYTSFSFDITPLLHEGCNTLAVICTDDTVNPLQPSGKQSMLPGSHGCFYTRTTGIWQTVWLEFTPQAYIKSAKYTPLTEENTLLIEALCLCADGAELKARATFGDEEYHASAHVSGEHASILLRLGEKHLWDVGQPNLYDLTLTLGDDTVESYFGMRSVACRDGKVTINGRRVFQRLVLDQGFYPDGIYTAPSDEALRNDILLSQAAGFNGARLHQKIFEERFLYHCDRLGYIVWGEHANWGLDSSLDASYGAFVGEWLEALARDYNHPAIIGWCPFNETSRETQLGLIEEAVSVTKAYDFTRPVIDTSGWFHGTNSDIYDTHDYDQNPETFRERLNGLGKGEILCPHVGVQGQYTFVSEYGGTASHDVNTGWGYGDSPASEEQFIARYRGLTDAILDNPNIFGFCYTQLTDVEQEKNGVYTYSRQPKHDIAALHAINTKKAAYEK